MDKQEYTRKLAELAEVKQNKPKKTPGIRLDETHQNDVRVGDEWILVNKDQNATLPLEFVKAKDVIRSCELGCGDIVTNQRIEKRLCWTPERHWRTKCATCGCYVSPDGLGFIEGAHQIQGAYIKHYNSIKGIKTKEGPEVKPNPNNKDEEIRDYTEERVSRWTKDADGNIVLRGG